MFDSAEIRVRPTGKAIARSARLMLALLERCVRVAVAGAPRRCPLIFSIGT
jgi:hypothetical protein